MRDMPSIDEEAASPPKASGGSRATRALHLAAERRPGQFWIEGNPEPRACPSGTAAHHPGARDQGEGLCKSSRPRPVSAGVNPTRANWRIRKYVTIEKDLTHGAARKKIGNSALTHRE
jgi:hypothetical protein